MRLTESTAFLFGCVWGHAHQGFGSRRGQYRTNDFFLMCVVVLAYLSVSLIFLYLEELILPLSV